MLWGNMTYCAIGNFIPVVNKAVAGAFKPISIIDCVIGGEHIVSPSDIWQK